LLQPGKVPATSSTYPVANCSVVPRFSSSIKIIDIATGRKRKLEASFSGGISTLAFTPCGRFLAASSSRTRELLVFDARADAGSDAPVFVLPVRGILTGLDTRTSANKDTIQVLGVFEDAGACYFELDANYNKDDSTGANSVRVETNIMSKLPIIAGHLGNTGNRDASGAVVAVGAKSSPVFKYVDLSAKQREIVLHESNIKADSDVHVNGSANGHSEGALFAPEVLGPHEMGGKKRPVVGAEVEEETNGQAQQKQSKKSKTSGDSMIVASADKGEQSLQDRLESLSASLAKLEEAESAEAGSSSKVGAAPTSDSLVTLIDQALQSGDDGLLEQCLACADADVVEATARRLPTSRVVMFLRKLVAKFEKRPSRGVLLTQWLSSLLRHHTAYLVTVPDLAHQLAGLSQMLEQRLASYSKLSALAGRLDLLMSQVNYRSNSVGGAGDALASAGRGMQTIAPMQVYQEE
jgi:U3 small nucleolar RNA-associated protein 5